MNNKHEFAIYFPALSGSNPSTSLASSGMELIIADKDLCHRIINILRMQLNEHLVLFDNKQNLLVEIIAITKKDIKVKVLRKDLNKALSPKITMLVSVLKREAFEEAIYYCVEMGANVIQPVITEKVHFKKWEDKEVNRLNRIIYAAAEQSKNFNFPELQEPKKLPDILTEIQNSAKSATKIFFDAQGQNLTEILHKSSSSSELLLLIGPEGDLTPQEKESLKKATFQFCKLTPTILRAQTAVSLALGMFRSLLK